MSKKKEQTTNNEAIEFVQYLRRIIGPVRLQELTDAHIEQHFEEFPAAQQAYNEKCAADAEAYAKAIEEHNAAVAESNRR